MIDDALIDSITISWVPGVPTKYTDATVAEFPGAVMLRGFLSRSSLSALVFFAEGVVEHTGRDSNDSGFRFGAEDDEDFDGYDEDDEDDDDDDDEDGDDEGDEHEDDDDDDDEDDVPIVHVFNPYETVTMSESAFVRLMARLFSTVVAGAVAEPSDVVDQDWWEEFVALTAQVEQLAEHT